MRSNGNTFVAPSTEDLLGLLIAYCNHRPSIVVPLGGCCRNEYQCERSITHFGHEPPQWPGAAGSVVVKRRSVAVISQNWIPLASL
jgi:hypothetical protein